MQLEIRHENKRKFVTTGIKLFKNLFKIGHVVNMGDAERTNERITNQIKEINDLVARLNTNRIKFSFDYLDHINDGYTSGCFLNFMEQRIEERPISKNTKMQHQKILNGTEENGHDFAVRKGGFSIAVFLSICNRK